MVTDVYKFLTNGHHHQEPPSLVDEARRLFAFLRRSWAWMFLGASIGVAATATHVTFAEKIYKASTKILVTSPPPIQPNAKPEEKESLTTQIGILASRVIVERAIRRVGAEKLPSLDPRDKAEDALTKLSVTCPDRTAKILRVDFTAKSKYEGVLFLTAIIDAYRDFLAGDLHGDSSQQVIDLVRGSEERLGAELGAANSRYEEFRKAHPSLILGPGPGKTPNSERLARLTATAGDLEVRSIRFRTLLDLARKLKSQGAGPWSIALAAGELGVGQDLLRSVDARSNSEHLKELVKERQKLVELHGIGVSKVHELDLRIAQLQGGTDDLLATLERIGTAVDEAKGQCDQKLAGLLRGVNSDEIDLLEEQRLRTDLEKRRSLYYMAVEQLKQATLAHGYSATSYLVIDPPKAEPRPIFPRTKIELAGGVVVGMALGALYSYAGGKPCKYSAA